MFRNFKRAVRTAAIVTSALVALAACGAAGDSTSPQGEATGAGASEGWSFPAIHTNPADGTTKEGTYEPIDAGAVSKPWRVCVLFPHMKDSYWSATNYGTLIEAKRDGLNYQMFEAGGYENLAKQVSQMQDCITQDYDAIVLGAISAQGLCAQIAAAVRQEIPVVDFINGTDCPQVADSPYFSHALVSFHDLAVTTAQYIVDNSEGEAVVGFFPGPEGAGWSDAAVEGFMNTIKGTDVRVAVTRRADTGLDTQLGLIEDALRAYPDITHLVGVDIAAEAAVVAARNANKEDELKIFAFDLIPPVHEAVLAGDAVGGPTDYTVMQGRMAIDQAVRMLEGEDLLAKMSGPIPEMVTAENAEDIPYTDMFAPKDFKATYNWSPEAK